MLGWKVARVRPELATLWGEDRIAGPIFNLWGAGKQAPVIALIESGYAAAEAEFALQIRVVPNGSSITMAEACEAIGAIRIGIEVAGSPFADINSHGPAVTVSDFGNNLGLVLGPIISSSDSHEAFDRKVSSHLNGEPVGTDTASNRIGSPFVAAHFLFELAARHQLDVKPGQWISTGAITGGHRVAPDNQFVARFGDYDQVACSFCS